MKIKEMINKIYKAFMSKEAIAALEAKVVQAEERERLAFIENNKQKLVPLSPLAQAILETLIERLNSGLVTVRTLYAPYQRWEVRIYDTKVEQEFKAIQRNCDLDQENKRTRVSNFYIDSPIAFPTEEGNTLIALFMKYYKENEDRINGERSAKKMELERLALAAKYQVTKE